jgi:hypothetical protein
MASSWRFFATLSAGLILSNVALAQTSGSPPTSDSKAPPATSSTTDDDGTNPLTHAGEDYSPNRPAPSQPRRSGAGPDPSATREAPVVNGTGTAGEGG